MKVGKDVIMNKKQKVERKEIVTPFGKAILETKIYPQFIHREEIIYWLGELKCIQLGKIITILTPEQRKSDFEPIKYKPLYYRVIWNKNADLQRVQDYHPSESISAGEIEFDEKDDTMKFINGLRCKAVIHGAVFTDTKKKFQIMKKVIEKVKQ